MKTSCLFATILALASLPALGGPMPVVSMPVTAQPASPLEQKYLRTRNAFIRKFSRETDVPDDDNIRALAELEKQLRGILGSVVLRGIAGPGRISLDSIAPQDPFFGMVDGLDFGTDDETAFVTTPVLLDNYLKAHPHLPRSLLALSRTGEFLQQLFDPDAAVYFFGDVPVTVPGGKIFAHAILGMSAQDIGPFEPKELFVLVSKPERILVFHANIKLDNAAIPECTRTWDKYERMYSEAIKVYDKSGLKDQKALEEMDRDEDLGFDAYRKCYADKVKDLPFFATFEKQAQAIVDRMAEDQRQ